MTFKFTRNIKIGIPVKGGDLVFDLRRPTKEFRNKHRAAVLDIDFESIKKKFTELENKELSAEEKKKLTDEARALTADVETRSEIIMTAAFDEHIESVYLEKEDGTKDPVVDDDEKAKDPKSFPSDIKAVVAGKMFSSLPEAVVKNL